jgi:uncharacterized protein YkwD
MHLMLALIFSFQSLGFLAVDDDFINPLESFDPLWNKTSYNQCNTAVKTKYFKQNEKEVIFILNLVRQFPQEFNKTVVAKWPEYKNRKDLTTNPYYTSLVKKLSSMQPVGLLRPDSICWVSAKCHAISSGKEGYVGHERLTTQCEKVSKFYGECCQYGYSTALEIVMSLLIDEDVNSLGHRIICLSPTYKTIGVSNQPHKGYGTNTVLDFSD